MEKKRVGIWIDRREAYMVWLEKGATQTIHLLSGVESLVARTGGSRTSTPYDRQGGGDERGRRSRHQQQLDRYFDQIIEEIASADAIVLLGPGEAKKQLRARIAEDPQLAPRLGAVETVARLTQRQLEALVRERFDGPPPRKERLP